VYNFDCKQYGVARQFGIFLGDNASALKTGGSLPRFVDPTDIFDNELEVDLAGKVFVVKVGLYRTRPRFAALV